MGGLNLEVFKFGIYIMFPIGFMYYFGTNLDNRFSVDGFWPKPEHSHSLPTDRSEIEQEVQRIMAVQRRVKARREQQEQEERQRDERQQRHQTVAASAGAETGDGRASNGGKKGWFW